MDDPITFLKTRIKQYLTFLISFGEWEWRMNRAVD